MDEKKMKKFIQAAGALTLPGGVSVAAFMNVYDKVFSRYERPNYDFYPGEYYYPRVKDKLPREEMTFMSDDIELMGYYYEKKSSESLVVICHGLHSGADDYLPMICFLYENGYSVFSFDYKGTYSSKGDSTVGMCESLVDLNHTLDFIENDERFRNKKICLLGHSWGGYAVLSVLCLNHDIKAVAAIAPMVDGYTMITEKATQYAGFLSMTTKPMLDVYQKYLFKEYTEYNAIKGINAKNIPIFIAQGAEDKVIDYYLQSVISHKKEIHNPNVKYYIGKGFFGDHDDIWHSLDSIAYRKALETKYKMLEHECKNGITNEDLKYFYSRIDHKKYSEVNVEVMEKILSIFEEGLKGE